MKELRSYLSEKVVVKVGGNRILPGKLIDAGVDLLVLLHQQRFLYIPMAHVHNVKDDWTTRDDDDKEMRGAPVLLEVDQISVNRMLQKAKGCFVEVYVGGRSSVHGYLWDVMADYMIISSPIYDSVYVALDHIKWLTPYPNSYVPYTRNNKSMMVQAENSGTTSFKEQLEKIKGYVVVIDLGSPSERIGVIKKVSNSLVGFIEVDGNNTLLHLTLIKTITFRNRCLRGE